MEGKLGLASIISICKEKTNMKNLPNILTLSRLVLTFLFIFFLQKPTLASAIWASFIFFIAAMTDYYDGYLAKKLDVASNFG